jgi:acyl-ACP thioesterase
VWVGSIELNARVPNPPETPSSDGGDQPVTPTTEVPHPVDASPPSLPLSLREAMADMVPVPVTGRTFTRGRRVRLGDVDPTGRLRFDATARYLQDVSNDDTRDAGLNDDATWVVRRTAIVVSQWGSYLEPLSLNTFCGGLGGRWAERRVVVSGELGAQIDATTLWVALDPTTLRPTALKAQFLDLYAEAAQGRVVRARLEHLNPTDEMTRSPWTLRATDFDVLGHMNNANYWNLVEELLAQRAQQGVSFDPAATVRAEVEFRHEIRPGSTVELVTSHHRDHSMAWLLVHHEVSASARLTVAHH